MVHSNTKLSNVQRFHYLRSSLSGNAKRVISSLSLSDSNYDIAWDRLCKRYNNKRLLVYNHIKAIHEIPHINRESSEELRKIIDTTKIHLESLKALGLDISNWDILMIFYLANKLDKYTFKEWEKFKIQSELPTLEDFEKFIEDKADLLEQIEQKQTKENIQHKCAICNGAHRIHNCHKFLELTVSSRNLKITELKHCVNCLKPNHTATECKAGTCRHCNAKHHSLLHIEATTEVMPRLTQNNANNRQIENTDATPSQNQNNSNQQHRTTVSMSNQYSHTENTGEVLLSTASVLVKDVDGNYQVCRALLDSASMSSFITSTCLWQIDLSWDDDLPNEIKTKWQKFKHDIQTLNSLEIPRQVICKNPVNIELHGFADASCTAFGAVIYLRSVDSSGDIYVNLLCSKSKVAPLKSLTIPKLELSGALLLAQLMKKVQDSLGLKINKVFLWLDSTIALSWIRSSASHYQVFVSNRIAQIQGLTSPEDWHYVNTKQNPADLVSRGIWPSSLLNNELWFHGPGWLSQDCEQWPKNEVTLHKDLPEKKKQIVSLVVNKSQEVIPFNKFSSYTKLKRVGAYVLRFIYNAKKHNVDKLRGPLAASELFQSTELLLRLAQRDSFYDDINILKKSQNLPKESKLLRLDPFLDSKNILRVGGRLHLSDLTFHQKHPVLLSPKHHFTQLLVRYEHLRLYHAGPRLLNSSLRENYWIVAGNNIIKKDRTPMRNLFSS
nr:unnamed protein product [Callosobruchus analis]